METRLTTDATHAILAALKKSNGTFRQKYPGFSSARQPVHTVYGGAQIFFSDTARKMGEVALKTLSEYAPNGGTLMKALGIVEAKTALWSKIHSRVVEKLKREAVEDFRIDFEDGYGIRSDSEEDGHAELTANEVAKGMKDSSLPPFIGIRIKPFSDECVPRSLRTLEIFLSQLVKRAGGMPKNFVVTLPKVTTSDQCKTLALILGELERRLNLLPQSIKFEVMIETPQAILNERGTSPLREFVDVGEGRCVAAHFGTYDYTAGCNISAHFQTMSNPVCDFAKHVMQVMFASTPILLSDGATNVMPIGPHRADKDRVLSVKQKVENRVVVHRAWKLSYQHIRHSICSGFYQGWDLHPNQLPIRYAATYSVFLENLDSATARLKAFVDKAAKASLLGEVFDDAATGQGLLNFFLRALSCGALTEAEVLRTGLTRDELEGRSFLKIIQERGR